MIVVKLIGGLGNQLFQYALGRRVSAKTGTKLKLDISGFETYTLHSYSLRHLNIQEDFATPAEIAGLIRYAPKKGNIWWPRNYIFADSSIYIKEKKELEFQFDPAITRIGDTAYLDGYWQNEKYFKDIENIIRKEFTITDALGLADAKTAQAIMGAHAVSIHIRRADYIANAKTNAIHGTCDSNYYLRAAEYIAAKVENPHFFIFSDDHEWVKQNITFRYPTTYVTHNRADKNYQDLRLMSMCQHNIIANSSFSWWGAWLNANPQKIIIAPQRWMNNSTRNTSDLIPQTWKKI